MIFVGMDVHVRNSFLHATDSAGRVLCRGRRGNTPDELSAFWSAVLKRNAGELEPARVVLEATTNSRPIRQMMMHAAESLGLAVTVDVVDPRKMRVIAESVAKTDALDARVLNELSRANLRLPSCYMPDDEEFALREHLRARTDLVRMRTMLKNRVHAVLHRRGILVPQGGLFTKDGRRFLEQIELDQAGRTIVTHLIETIDQFTQMTDESNGALKALQRRPRWARPAAILQTMPGIGLITALTILAELGDLKRFKSRAAVANYAGLVPIVRSSNTKHYSGGITHRGPQHLRGVLAEAAWVAIRRVPVYQALFERVGGRRGKQVAIVAVARRMLEDGIRMLWKQEPFRFVPAKTPSVEAGDSRGDANVAASQPHGERSVVSSVAG